MKQISLLCLCAFSLTASMVAAESYKVVEDNSSLTILSPAFSERKSVKIRLENGLEAYLISDPSVSKSAMALSVGAGSWDNPPECAGMAHFVEHLLFEGTSAYPGEGSYDRYLKDHGGYSNAFTFYDRTVYGFAIPNEAFFEMLDRFSHFFIDPLFSPAAIKSELHAVDHEFGEAVDDEFYRIWRTLKETGNLAHPNALLSVGNAETLSSIPRSEILRWYNAHYTPDNMHLFVVSPLEMQALLDQVVAKFSAVPRREKAERNFSAAMFSTKQKGHMVYVEPVLENEKTLLILWEMPEEVAQNPIAAKLLKRALMHEGKNSLLSLLRKENLAGNLAIAPQSLSGKSQMLLLAVDLTDAGLLDVDAVLTRVFGALASVREEGIPSYIFKEKVELSKLVYEYPEKQDVFDLAMEGASRLINEELAGYPKKLYQPSAPAENLMEALLSSLTPQEAVFVTLAPFAQTGVSPTKMEKWTKARYLLREIPEEHLKAWEHAAPLAESPIVPENPFHPDVLGSVAEPSLELHPVLLDKDETAEVYFARDSVHLLPKDAVILHFNLPKLVQLGVQERFLDTYSEYLEEKLAATLQFARKSGVHCSFRCSGERDFTLFISGFHGAAAAVAREVVQKMKALHCTPEELFLQENSEEENDYFPSPLFQAEDVLFDAVYGRVDEELYDFTDTEIAYFLDHFLEEGHVTGAIYGCMTEEEASALWRDLKNTLKLSPIAAAEEEEMDDELEEEPSSSSAGKVLEQPGFHRIEQSSPLRGHAAILLVECPGLSLVSATHQVLEQILDQEFFRVIRSQKHLTYNPEAMPLFSGGHAYFAFGAQSSTHSAEEMLKHFEVFHQEFRDNLETIIPRERFETIRQMLCTPKAPYSLSFDSIALKLSQLNFDLELSSDYSNCSQKELEDLTYETFLENVREVFSGEKRLAVLINGEPL